MCAQRIQSNETTFTISGRIKTAALIAALSTIFGLGGLTMKVNSMMNQIEKLEQQANRNVEDHTQILGNLISIQENTKYLRERIEDIKMLRGNK